MFTKKNKVIMRKKKMWPSIVIFCVFLVICAGSVAVSFAQFRVSEMNAGLASMQDERMQVGYMLERLLAESGKRADEMTAGEWEKLLERVVNYQWEEFSLCITDRDGNVISRTGDYVPDFQKSVVFELGKDYIYYADAGEKEPDACTGLEIGGDDVPFEGRHRITLGQYLRGGEEILKMCAWNEITVTIPSMRLFCRAEILVTHHGIANTTTETSVMIVLFGIPMCLFLCYMLSAIRAQQKATDLLWLDSVTGGNNKLCFVNCAQEIVSKRSNRHRSYALVDIHVRRYQDYCACYGAGAGNFLLKKLDGYFRVRVYKTETYGRFSQSDFALLLESPSRDETERRVRKMLTELSGVVEDTYVLIQAGINLLPRGDVNRDDVEQAYHLAEVARITGLENSAEKYAFFEEDIIKEHMWHHYVLDNLDSAIRNEEFIVYLQPKYNPVSGKMVGAEALVRWQSEQGMIPPGRFIPILEESGGIVKLDDYMISQVAKIQAERKLQGKEMIPISVNVSRKHFVQGDLAEHICQLVDVYGADRKLIEIEVTESAFMNDQDTLLEVLLKLRAYGFVISMDDFGAGYSSLNSLKELPIDVLKLDMAFFRGDEDVQEKSRIIVEESIRLAKKLDIRVVAEGIETKEQMEFLKLLQCEMIQGYYYAKPMPLEEFEQLAESDI